MKQLKDTLWKAADKLRGSMDASQYKDVILGLVFLKYASDAFGERRAAPRCSMRQGCSLIRMIEEFISPTSSN